jgi:hypothetical protein
MALGHPVSINFLKSVCQFDQLSSLIIVHLLLLLCEKHGVFQPNQYVPRQRAYSDDS